MYQWLKIDITQLPLVNISGCSLKVFLGLASIMDDTLTAQCSYKQLCQSLCISKRSAYRSVKELEEKQLIHRTNLAGQILTVRFLRCISVGRTSSPRSNNFSDKVDYVSPLKFK